MDFIITLLKGISDKNRLRIITLIDEHNGICSCQLASILNISAASISQHMNILIKANICSSQKFGRWVYFKINYSQPLINEVIALARDTQDFIMDKEKVTCLCKPSNIEDKENNHCENNNPLVVERSYDK